jgi:hypothetical protein
MGDDPAEADEEALHGKPHRSLARRKLVDHERAKRNDAGRK